jgi:hypothetical protein
MWLKGCIKMRGALPRTSEDTNMMAANYPTKKALKAAKGSELSYTETSMFGAEYVPNGKFCVVGPSPYNRKWFAQVTMVDGLIGSVS